MNSPSSYLLNVDEVNSTTSSSPALRSMITNMSKLHADINITRTTCGDRNSRWWESTLITLRNINFGMRISNYCQVSSFVPARALDRWVSGRSLAKIVEQRAIKKLGSNIFIVGKLCKKCTCKIGDFKIAKHVYMLNTITYNIFRLFTCKIPSPYNLFCKINNPPNK